MKLGHVPLNEQLYFKIKQDIIDGKIELGQKLTNRELQKEYGVSSSPIRDAINRLYVDGILEDISSSGAKVSSFELKYILDINETLGLICGAGVESAAKHTDQSEIYAHLKNILLEQEQAICSDEFYRSDYLFHKVFFDYSQNLQFRNIYNKYHVLMEMIARRIHVTGSSYPRPLSLKQHRKIFETYQAKNISLAAELMRSHFLDASDFFRTNMC